MKKTTSVLLVLLFSVSLPAQQFGDTRLLQTERALIKVVTDPSEKPETRIAAAGSLLTNAHRDRLSGYLGMALPPHSAWRESEGNQLPNLAQVGHQIKTQFAPLRPDVQVHYEIAAMLWVRDFEKNSQTSSLVEERLLDLAQISTAIVGAEALNAGEKEVWDQVRIRVVENIRRSIQRQNSDGAKAPLKARESLAESQQKNVVELKTTLLNLSKQGSVQTKEKIEALLEIRLNH